ncbi:hypothetical protein CC86DRAFT_431649 [Ophiobolus disseminans]|uniref:TPR-like protein n=1 Tax=Ophiobolus disseminans TaxID=1469910 RepID=A0A6A7AG88_9PLEO|nr:hypothetical protein CC86DRAFT_431649 [Ophiobolus disseminans]
MELLRMLGHFPLAITQVAAYINQQAPRVTIQDYLNVFCVSIKNRESLLNRDAGDLRRDHSATNSVVTTWQLTFECVRKENRSAADLLLLICLFNPQAVPAFALRSHNKGMQNRIRRSKHMFLVLQYLKDQHKSNSANAFHDDVAVLQAYSLQSERYRMAFVDLIEKEFLSQKTGNWEEYKQLVPHIDTFYPGEPGDKSFHRWGSLTIAVGKLLHNKRKYNEAAILYQRALEGREKELGLRHPDTLASMHNLASVLRDQGKYKETEKLNWRALEGREKELGVCHPDTLTSVYSLARL